MRNVSSSSTAALAAAVALALLGACRPGDGDPPVREIRIGVLAVLDGVQRETSGEPTLRGAELAVRPVNDVDRGVPVLIDGEPHRIALVVKSYEDRPDSAASEARALINQEAIDVLIGPQFSRHAIPVAVVAENAQMPMLSPMSSNPATTEGKRFVFRLAFLDDVQGEVMGRFALDDLDATTAGVLYDRSTAYGRDLAAVFRETFEAGGGRVVSFESYSRDAAEDFSEQLSRVKRASPDVLYLPNDTQPVLAQVRQARAMGIDVPLLGGDTWDLQTFRTMPECDGSYIAHQWHPQLDTREAKAFVERYRAAFGEEPKVTAAMTFDAVSLMVDVLRRVESLDPAAIREGLLETTDFVGATGRVGFDGRPDPERSVMISTIQDGESRLLRAEVR